MDVMGILRRRADQTLRAGERRRLLGARVCIATAPAALVIPLLVCWPATAVAVTEVDEWSELVAAVAAGGEVQLGADLDAPAGEGLEVPSGVASMLNLNGHTLRIESPATGAAAIRVPIGAQFSVLSGRLSARGNGGGAGIGGALTEGSGAIIVLDAVVEARGSADDTAVRPAYSAGIGGGAGRDGGVGSSNDGTRPPGVDAGNGGDATSIRIERSEVTADRIGGGAGGTSGWWSETSTWDDLPGCAGSGGQGGDVWVEDSTVRAERGIGGGHSGFDGMLSPGATPDAFCSPPLGGSAGRIVLLRVELDAGADLAAAAIGGGGANSLFGSGGDGGSVSIEHSTITARAGFAGAGIGGGGTWVWSSAWQFGGDAADVSIVRSSVQAVGGNYAPGIGGGWASQNASAAGRIEVVGSAFPGSSLDGGRGNRPESVSIIEASGDPATSFFAESSSDETDMYGTFTISFGAELQFIPLGAGEPGWSEFFADGDTRALPAVPAALPGYTALGWRVGSPTGPEPVLPFENSATLYAAQAKLMVTPQPLAAGEAARVRISAFDAAGGAVVSDVDAGSVLLDGSSAHDEFIPTVAGASTVEGKHLGVVLDPLRFEVDPGPLDSLSVSGSLDSHGNFLASAIGFDAFGNEIGVMTDQAQLSSSAPGDVIEGDRVILAFDPASLGRTGSREITASIGSVIGTTVIQVPSRVAQLRLVAPRSATAGDTIAVTATALDADGRELGDVSGYLEVSSSVAADRTEGNRVTFGSASPHVLTAVYGDHRATVAVEVSPRQTIPATGGVLGGVLWWGGALLAVATCLLIAGQRRPS